MLTPAEAENILAQGAQLNPGRWEQHSISAGTNARLIARKTGIMDEDKAYAMGLLHDIGRRAGVTQILHIFDGYSYLTSLGEAEAARICLTHSYPGKDVYSYLGEYDCSKEQLDFLQDFLNHTEYDDYDRLIQLCDVLSLPSGACIMEKRFVDVTLRYGLSEATIGKWKSFIGLKKYFDRLCGCSIYSLLPNVLENSAEDLI